MFDDIFNFIAPGFATGLDPQLDSPLDSLPGLDREPEQLELNEAHYQETEAPIGEPEHSLAERPISPIGWLPTLLAESLQAHSDLPELAGSRFETWGEPLDDASHWQKQTGANSCAVVAQASIYEAITGNPLSEAQACQIAEHQGWFDPEIGTRPAQMGALLHGLGLETHGQYNGTLEDIARALEQGNKVMVGLDAREVWTPQHRPLTNQPMEQPDVGHAVWVTGLREMPDGSVQVVVNDSGIDHGRMCSIDAQDFLNAWDDFDNLLVVAEASPMQQIPQFA